VQARKIPVTKPVEFQHWTMRTLYVVITMAYCCSLDQIGVFSNCRMISLQRPRTRRILVMMKIRCRNTMKRPSYSLPVSSNDVLFIAGLVAYIHDVALLDLYCPHVTSGRLAVCYSQIRSILSSATAFPTATLRWQQSRYRTINGKKIKTYNFVSVIKYISCIYD